eukprot:m.293173 g.293173  ORF g.293173 m.293173 type:complete len:372 (-) comp20015_c0_seq12:353-1468(-)
MEWMKGFVRRHKWKLAILGTGAATVYAAKAYLDGKIRELEQQALEEHISRARRQTHFESNEESCNITVESLLPSLYQALEESLGAVELLAKLRVAPSPDDKPNAKAILWQALSIKVLTGAIAASYSLGLLVVFLRVQLNVLGGYLYISTMPENAAKDPISSEVQRKFLGLVEHLQTQGIQDLIAWIEPVVDEVFQQSKLVVTSSDVDHADIMKLLQEVQMRLEAKVRRHDSPYAAFLLPDHIDEASQPPATDMRTATTAPDFYTLMCETKDVLEAPQFRDSVRACVNKCFHHFDDSIRMRLSTIPRETQEPKKPYLLFQMLPIVKQQTKQLFNPTCGPLAELLTVKEVKELSLSVYESFSNVEHPISPDER